ncbi:pyocin activator PrtN family protein [Pseudomonas aeruginosa]|nr:hypothetical protein B8A54_19955 [Pseudomonas aeruginosa]
MNTFFLLMAQYHGQTIVSLSRVCADYFTHLESLRGVIGFPRDSDELIATSLSDVIEA